MIEFQELKVLFQAKKIIHHLVIIEISKIKKNQRKKIKDYLKLLILMEEVATIQIVIQYISKKSITRHFPRIKNQNLLNMKRINSSEGIKLLNTVKKPKN